MSIDIFSFIRFHIIPYSLSFQTFNAWKQLECLSVDETINQCFSLAHDPSGVAYQICTLSFKTVAELQL